MSNSISGGVEFYIENRGVIFGDLFAIFPYKIFNIEVESIKIVSKMEIMDGIARKILNMKISIKIDKISTKNDIFYKKASYSKLHFVL